jgi:hypothetical protein
VKGKLPHRIKPKDKLAISKRLVNLKSHFPSDFQRKPRTLSEIDHFKGTEFRTLILYTGTVVLDGILPKNYLTNFRQFHVAMFILLSDMASDNEWNKVAHDLLERFVKGCMNVYGSQFLVYNIHGLLHIHTDGINFGNLDNVSTFPFENFMQRIKKLLYSNNYLVEQVAKRLVESESLNTNFSLYINSNNSFINLYSLKRICKNGDNCFKLNSGKIVKLVEFDGQNGLVYTFKCQEFLYLSKVKHYPIDSTSLGIYRSISLSEIFVIPLNNSDIFCKYLCLPHKNSYFCLPLLHTVK